MTTPSRQQLREWTKNLTLDEIDPWEPTEEQLDFLVRVNDGDGSVVPSASEVGMMARLLQGHMLLSHLNGADWYEVHPLARRALRLR